MESKPIHAYANLSQSKYKASAGILACAGNQSDLAQSMSEPLLYLCDYRQSAHERAP